MGSKKNSSSSTTNMRPIDNSYVLKAPLESESSILKPAETGDSLTHEQTSSTSFDCTKCEETLQIK